MPNNTKLDQRKDCPLLPGKIRWIAANSSYGLCIDDLEDARKVITFIHEMGIKSNFQRMAQSFHLGIRPNGAGSMTSKWRRARIEFFFAAEAQGVDFGDLSNASVRKQAILEIPSLRNKYKLCSYIMESDEKELRHMTSGDLEAEVRRYKIDGEQDKQVVIGEIMFRRAKAREATGKELSAGEYEDEEDNDDEMDSTDSEEEAEDDNEEDEEETKSEDGYGGEDEIDIPLRTTKPHTKPRIKPHTSYSFTSSSTQPNHPPTNFSQTTYPHTTAVDSNVNARDSAFLNNEKTSHHHTASFDDGDFKKKIILHPNQPRAEASMSSSKPQPGYADKAFLKTTYPHTGAANEILAAREAADLAESGILFNDSESSDEENKDNMTLRLKGWTSTAASFRLTMNKHYTSNHNLHPVKKIVKIPDTGEFLLVCKSHRLARHTIDMFDRRIFMNSQVFVDWELDREEVECAKKNVEAEKGSQQKDIKKNVEAEKGSQQKDIKKNAELGEGSQHTGLKRKMEMGEMDEEKPPKVLKTKPEMEMDGQNDGDHENELGNVLDVDDGDEWQTTDDEEDEDADASS